MYDVVGDPKLRMFGAPREYIQGPGAIRELPRLAARYGSGRLFAVVDPFLVESVCPMLEEAFGAAGMKFSWAAFGGECTVPEGERLAALMDDADVVAGVGGGKCVDVAKYAALARKAAAFSIPTLASNDAPTSRLIVLYDEHHTVAGTKFMQFNPDVVLVDTDIIGAAPARFLRAGIGDALTKAFEARAVVAADGLNFFSARPAFVTSRLGEICFETITAFGPACLDALARGENHANFEQLVEALILLGGITFESGGLSIAHSMPRGLTRVPEIAAFLHGEQVAYGVLVQLELEGDREMLSRVVAFSRSIGLPCRLTDFGIAPARQATDMETIAEGAMTAPYMQNFPRQVGLRELVEAMQRIERIN